MTELRTADIRQQFIELSQSPLPLAENGTMELINTSFIADEEAIFGEVNHDYVRCELKWYKTASLNIYDMPCKIPEIWKQIATKDGFINSNYGWCIYSWANGSQFEYCIETLIEDPASRQACMIYIRPDMHTEAFENGMKDFICTYSAQLMIRKNKLHYIVYMRSNDAVYGYKNDRAWHDYVFNESLGKLKEAYPDLEKGNLYWNAASLHVYPKHFKLVEKCYD
jgi:thymidylate synthase